MIAVRKEVIVMRHKKDDTYYRFKSKKHTRHTRSTCTICGKTFDFLSTVHAKKCGNCTPNEMIERKLVIPVMKPIEWEED